MEPDPIILHRFICVKMLRLRKSLPQALSTSTCVEKKTECIRQRGKTHFCSQTPVLVQIWGKTCPKVSSLRTLRILRTPVRDRPRPWWQDFRSSFLHQHRGDCLPELLRVLNGLTLRLRLRLELLRAILRQDDGGQAQR